MSLVARLRDGAACAVPGIDPRLFDSTVWTPRVRQTIHEYCRACPVTDLCVAVVRGGLGGDCAEGVFGGRVWARGHPVPDPLRPVRG